MLLCIVSLLDIVYFDVVTASHAINDIFMQHNTQKHNNEMKCHTIIIIMRWW